MEKPILNKPTIQEWKNQEDVFARLLDNIEKNVFDVNKWEFNVPDLNEMINYKELMKKINSEKYIKPVWSDTMRTFFKHLPEEFIRMKKDLISAMKGFTATLQERMNYEKQLEEYCNAVENELDSVNAQLEDLQKERELMMTKSRVTELEAKLKESREQYEFLTKSLQSKPDELSEPIKEEEQNTNPKTPKRKL